jgi:hypothetical protein
VIAIVLAQRVLYALGRDNGQWAIGGCASRIHLNLERRAMNGRKQYGGGFAVFTRLAVILTTVGVVACGGGNPPDPVPSPTPAAPAAAITGTGAGNLTLHPSIDRRFAIAMETPIRLAETAGGTADWGFARMQIFNRGVEVERTELTATDIRAAGYGRIAANSNQVYNVIYRFNSSDFDRIDLTLGFSDVKDARQFTVSVPFNSFADIGISFTPLSLEHSRSPL